VRDPGARALLLVACMAAMEYAHGQNEFVCTGTNSSTPVRDQLRGKRLLVCVATSSPMAYYRNPAPLCTTMNQTSCTVQTGAIDGWMGHDVELLARVAEMLGFTYSIYMLEEKALDQMWTDYIKYWTNQDDCDLIIGAWMNVPERKEHTTAILGHLDMSTVLVARHLPNSAPGLSVGSLFSVFAPFHWTVWMSLIGIVLLSGVVDYLLERGAGGERSMRSLRNSIFEYSAGAIFGGFQEPKTRASALYQLLIGFILVVFVATYTANLTVFFTTAESLSYSAVSIADVQENGRHLCMGGVGAYKEVFHAIYPTVSYTPLSSPDVAREALAKGQCDAAVLSRFRFDTLRNDPTNCNLEVVEVLWRGPRALIN